MTAEIASAADIITIIEGKLQERDQNPVEIQVTVQGSDDDDGTLFLINDEGVILTVEAVIDNDSHVPDAEVGSITSSYSATSAHSSSVVPTTTAYVIVPRSERDTVVRSHTSRVGKAPPIDTFTGENIWED